MSGAKKDIKAFETRMDEHIKSLQKHFDAKIDSAIKGLWIKVLITQFALALTLMAFMIAMILYIFSRIPFL